MISRKYLGGLALMASAALVQPLAAVSAQADAGAQNEPLSTAKLTRNFASREDVRQISMSPDGTQVAFVSSREPSGEVVNVVSIEDGSLKGILSSSGQDQHIHRCSWISNKRLLCNISMRTDSTGQLLSFSRMVGVNADGSDMKVLDENRSAFRALGFSQFGGSVIDLKAGDPGEVLVTKQYLPESSEGTRLAQTREGLGVDRLDAASLRRKVVEQPHRSAVEYISDGRGAVRIMGLQPGTANGYDSTFIEYMYRAAGEHSWRALGKLEFPEGAALGFNPVAVDPELDLVYGFDRKDGYQALYSMSLDGNLTRNLVMAHPGVDVDGLIRIGRERRVVGVTWATDRRHSALFDPELSKLTSALAKALPGDGDLTILDSSEDENRLLLLSDSDVNPGMVYLFDKTTRQLDELVAVRPQLAGMTLSPMHAVQYPAADGTMIPAYLTMPPGKDVNAKGLPTIVMPHGGPAARDEWGFDWLVQYFAQRGYAVLQPNYRGSAGYGDEWFERNGYRSWRSAIGDVDDAGRWLVKQGIADKDKLAIVGWSYGGYAALQSGVTDPGLYKAIVAIAPVTDLELKRQNARNYTNYRVVDGMIGDGPHVREGSPAQNAERIAVPVLMFSGDEDLNVDVSHARLMERRLKDAGKQVEYVEFPKLAHQLDDTAARMKVLGDSDAFLRETMHIN